MQIVYFLPTNLTFRAGWVICGLYVFNGCVHYFELKSQISQPKIPNLKASHNVTLQCKNTLKVPGHVAWFKQVNESEPLCIVSMYSTLPYVIHRNGFQPSRMEMLIKNETVLLKITDVDIADCGRYFCGLFDSYFIFTNATVLYVIGNDRDSDALNYATVNITSRNIKRKMQRREIEQNPHVVYAATR
uniref:Immunoglobulin V-set domain-containing protein n=1 Tax=Esox lucius TaxID=8010 RepID=A0AAY5L637_ESOLU